jgi:hypothetical protein
MHVALQWLAELGVHSTISFYQICCNLVVSFLQKPENEVAELSRLLRLAGKVAVTRCEPNPDLSEVYRNFVAVRRSDDEITEAGVTTIKEGRGLYRFFPEKELTRLVRRCER